MLGHLRRERAKSIEMAVYREKDCKGRPAQP